MVERGLESDGVLGGLAVDTLSCARLAEAVPGPDKQKAPKRPNLADMDDPVQWRAV